MSTKMSKKEMRVKAQKIMMNGKHVETSGNDVWKHEWYRMKNGTLAKISYKNGKLDEVDNLGW